MKYLLDTNIVIPLEPASKLDLEVNTPLALEFHRLAAKLGQDLFVHPEIETYLLKDKDKERSSLRQTLLGRYQRLITPPTLSQRAKDLIGAAPVGSNDRVDHQLLGSLEGNAVDYLVTEDSDIHKKARRLGLQSRTLHLSEAITLLQDLFEEHPSPPPAVEKVYVYQLDSSDAIFESFRRDYPAL